MDRLHPVDWSIVGLYILFALFVGMRFARRASKNVDEFFLAGRSLPWWIAGTSMVATTFAADTPLLITGWVRDHGIWKNWAWWCFAINGMVVVFLFARYWRRGRVMTTAELSELRYGGRDAAVLRGFLGIVHATFVNTIILCWVILAASKIAETAFDIPKFYAVAIAGILALTYSLLAGFWGVVLTDLLQFVMAMVGAVALAVIALQENGGVGGIIESVQSLPNGEDILRFVPRPGSGSVFEASFFTTSFAVFLVYMGVSWWAAHGVDGGPTVVQRIAAARDERQGMLAALWYQIAHNALRPWPWFLVALASLAVLPSIRVTSPGDGIVRSVDEDARVVVVETTGEEAAVHELSYASEDESEFWRVRPTVEADAEVAAGDVIASTDSEAAYPAMMMMYLPIGLLGLVVASLFAAFMSTIDTHVNLASSYFVNDVYRRFIRPDREPREYVLVARLSSVVVLVLACVFAYFAKNISDLFMFFLAFLAGVGPVYVARWFWWRVRASTEIAAMTASMVAAVVLTKGWVTVDLGALSAGGELTDAGRVLLVALFSGTVALVSVVFTRDPDPRTLVDFYRRVRPMGIWHPVRHHCRDVRPPRELVPVVSGVFGGLALTFGLLFAIGYALLGEPGAAMISAAAFIAGFGLVYWALAALRTERSLA